MRRAKQRNRFRLLLILFALVFLTGGVFAFNSGSLRLAGTVRIAPEPPSELPWPEWQFATPTPAAITPDFLQN